MERDSEKCLEITGKVKISLRSQLVASNLLAELLPSELSRRKKISMRKFQGVGSDFTRKLSKKRKLLGPHVFGARLKTTQKWDDLGQVGIDNAMIDPT